MAISVGEKIPNVTVQHMTPGGPADISTDELFSGRKVVLFALPGAFTPTCSAAHLPGYVVHADDIKAKGVDEIVCLAVNDAFVMDAWGKALNVEDRVHMIADGSAVLTEALGLQLDLTARGLGVRSDRYAMIIDDGVVKALFREAPGKFEVSGADQVINAL